MAQYPDLEQLAAKIQELDLKLSKLRMSMAYNDADIARLEEFKALTEENISILKSRNIIAVASEFRRSKENLKKAETRLGFLYMNRLTYERAYAGNSAMYERLIALYNENLERIRNNVVYVDFGRKDGR